MSVLDRGPGIPAADRLRVTERFFRGANASAAGSGLGLSIAQAALQRFGARLEFAARADGGEAVRVVLPCAGPSGNEPPMPDVEKASSKPRS
ncbi:sensor histidine kinase [Limimaricola litoreus]|uniref:sensor histidine kinase n=1 Tax=Limimaricola litoreus TaxID=2955316 RepID=UPI003514CB68